MQPLQACPSSMACRHFRSVAALYMNSNAAAQSARASRAAPQIFKRRPALLLERAVGEKLGADEDLWKHHLFNAGVTPDLPVLTSWKQLGATLLGRCVSTEVHTDIV